ncbi:uncharacterized protein L203_103433 [Cryptococcus depauperatus CBS 7841]|uniref:Uncharacterized protein n=1 Tax=Cryptococcus depauperatus CBS 7841 TaxID=1295531 RepID=A0AAJ8M229_9TREE
MRSPVSILYLALLAGLAQGQGLSCSQDVTDPCLGPTPGGLFVFRQRFEPDVGGDHGSWGIEGLEVLDCGSQTSQNGIAYAPALSHEQIGSFCLQSALFADETKFIKAEREWTQSEAGEGVEELWERAWNTAGRFISTFDRKCNANIRPEDTVPEFFAKLHMLHSQLNTTQLLVDNDITSSDDTAYSLSEITSALSINGNRPVVFCDNSTLSAVHWPLVVRGTLQTGSFEPTLIFRRLSNCPSEGIIYQPSTIRPMPTETATWDPIFRPSPRPITLSHDESKLYYKSIAVADPRKKLKLFREYDQEKEEEKEDRAERKFWRDEL